MKQCSKCMSEIHQNAKKCPFCREWQTKFSGFLNSFPIKVLFVVLVSIGFIFLTIWIEGPNEFEMAKKTRIKKAQLDSIFVQSQDWVWKEIPCEKTIIIGHLFVENALRREINYLHVQVEFFEQGSLVFGSVERISDDILGNSKISATISIEPKLKFDFDSVQTTPINASLNFEI